MRTAALLETVLFLWLSPGMVFNVPSLGARWFFSETTSWQAILVHTVMFSILLWLLKSARLVEGFQETQASTQTSTQQSGPQTRTASSNKRRMEERLAENQFFGAL